jgi:hypothetical protein
LPEVNAVPDFDGLRQRLEAAARPPAFTEIRARRATRTRRRVVVGAALATAVVLAASIGTTAALRGLGTPIQPAVTSTPPTAPTTDCATPNVCTPSVSPSLSETTDAGAGPPEIWALAPTSAGRLFAIVTRCVSGCLGNNSQHEVALFVTSDLGAHWEKIGPVSSDGSMQLIVADDAHLWTVSGTEVSGSSDGGHTWGKWRLGQFNSDGPDVRVAVASGVAWISSGLDVWRATGGKQPTRAGKVGTNGQVFQLTAVDDRHAYASVGQDVSATWRTTSDGGAHWADIADPCTGTRFVGSMFSTMAAGPDGSLWVVCAGEPGAGNMPKDLVISTDGGHTWVKRGELESSGYATDVRPFSATTAWRTGGRASIFRTTDGTHWTAVTPYLELDGPGAFASIDAKTAVYVEADVQVTRDGGATWTSYPVPS